MSYRLRFHAEANRELVLLYDYIADESGEERAWNYVSSIRRFCLDLILFPKRGTERTEIMPGLRIIGYRHSVSIAFVVDEAEVLILGIYYGGRQILFDDLLARIEDDDTPQ